MRQIILVGLFVALFFGGETGIIQASPPLCAITATIYKNSVPSPGVRVTFYSADTQRLAPLSAIVRKSSTTLVSGANGVLPSVNLIQGLPIFITVGDGNPQHFTVPAASTVDLTGLLLERQ